MAALRRMQDAPQIKGISVVLEDGRYQWFAAADLEAARGFSECRIWELLQFITSLAPPAAEDPDTSGELTP